VTLLAGRRFYQRHELILLGERFQKIEDKWDIVEAPPRVFNLNKWKDRESRT
jgi:hypothetical protein